MVTKKIILSVIIGIVLIVVIGFIYFSMNKTSGTSSNGNIVDASNENPDPSANDPNVKTIYVNGDNFKFIVNGKENPDITVKRGDKIKIIFKSIGGFHDFVIDELNAKTSRINDGDTTSIEFTADKIGTFEYYCGVGTHRQMGMKGKFIVE